MSDWIPTRCAIIGATGGIGRGFIHHLEKRDGIETLWRLSRSHGMGEPTTDPNLLHLDYDDSDSIQQAAQTVASRGPLDLVIVATGLLHDADGLAPEKALRDLDANRLARNFHINTIGPALAMQAFLPLLRKDRKTVFAVLSARVGSISDNQLGGWYGYRAAKAALNQVIKTASIEHKRRWPKSILVGLHPGTVDTGLSKPFQRNVAEGKLFSAEHSTAKMLQVIDRLSAEDSGKVFAFDGSEVLA